MGKRKKASPDKLFRLDRFEKVVAVRPLFGRERLVKIERRKQHGVLFCNSIMSISDTITFSDSNTRTSLYMSEYLATAPAFLGEPRLNVANEASVDDMRRFHDEGRRYMLTFTPKKGNTYSFNCDIYRPFEIHFGGALFNLADDMRVGRYVLKLDLSAYVETGHPIQPPQCDFEVPAIDGRKAGGAQPGVRRLLATDRGGGRWEWNIDDVVGGFIRWAWVICDRDPSLTFNSIAFDRLATELSVDPRVTKDLHNFVSLCQYFAADFRSMHEIERNMIVTRSARSRSLESIEQLVGAELIQRNRSKGLIQITPTGEALLEWWSQFYMRWTPIAPSTAGAKTGRLGG